MNINKIAKVLSLQIPDEQKRSMILLIIAKDKDAIPHILNILKNEREYNEELLLDINEELSKALVTLIRNDEKTKRGKDVIEETALIIQSIKNHYLKFAETIRCCFKIDGLP